MKVSVVIPSYNRKHHLEHVLKALYAQTLSFANYEIILVNDGSTDTTIELSLEDSVRLINLSQRRGAAAARNAGVAQSKGEIIAFIDADILVKPDFLQTVVNIHQSEEKCVALGPRRHLPQDCFRIDSANTTLDTRDKLLRRHKCKIDQLQHPWCFSYTCNLSLKREHYPPEGFDESFTGWGLEDVEFGYRLHMQGMTFIFPEELTCYHLHHPRDVTSEKFGEWRRNLSLFMHKHPDKAVQQFACFMDVFNPDVKADYFETFDRFQGMAHG